MSNEDINRTYNAFRGVQGFAGDINVLTAMTHYFLMDASYDNFRKNVRSLPLKHENKRIVKMMSGLYDAFFTKFFAPFNLEQRIYLGEKSDALREYIKNDVERARIAMMDCCDDEPIDIQAKIADLWLCNRFASEAQSFYQRTWKKAGFMMRGVLYTKPDTDKDIDGILKYTIALADKLYGDGEMVSEKHYEKFQKCVAALTRKICDWISEDYKQEAHEQYDPHAAAAAGTRRAVL